MKFKGLILAIIGIICMNLAIYLRYDGVMYWVSVLIASCIFGWLGGRADIK